MRRIAFFVLVVVGAFVFWHTGGRGGALCERVRFVPGSDLSWWPPGARCTWGEPASSGVFLNPWFFATVFVIAVLLVALSLRGSSGSGDVRAALRRDA